MKLGKQAPVDPSVNEKQTTKCDHGSRPPPQHHRESHGENTDAKSEQIKETGPAMPRTHASCELSCPDRTHTLPDKMRRRRRRAHPAGTAVGGRWHRAACIPRRRRRGRGRSALRSARAWESPAAAMRAGARPPGRTPPRRPRAAHAVPVVGVRRPAAGAGVRAEGGSARGGRDVGGVGGGCGGPGAERWSPTRRLCGGAGGAVEARREHARETEPMDACGRRSPMQRSHVQCWSPERRQREERDRPAEPKQVEVSQSQRSRSQWRPV